MALAKLVAVTGAVLWLIACVSMTMVNDEVHQLAVEERYAEAAQVLEQAEDVYGEKNLLLWDLERAMMLHLAGNYEASNRAFEDAKRVAEVLETRSVTRGLGTLVVNDRTLEYAGQHFERALIHVFAALNYAKLGLRERALVEARQLDHQLRRFWTDYGDRYTYREDAFGRYLAGMLYEEAGDLESARVSYWKALEAYEWYAQVYAVQTPRSLRRAAWRVARGDADRRDEFVARWGVEGDFAASSEEAATLMVLHYNGSAPRKYERLIDMSFGDGWAYVNNTTAEGYDEDQLLTAAAVAAAIPASDTIRVALPVYSEVGYSIDRMAVRLDRLTSLPPAELVEDVGAIAVRDLEDRIRGIRIRAFARAAIKYALARSVSAAAVHERDPQVRAAEEIASALLRAYAVLSERADTRSWTAVPDEIWMAQGRVAAGLRHYEISFYDADRRLVDRRSGSVLLRPGERSIVIVRTLR